MEQKTPKQLSELHVLVHPLWWSGVDNPKHLFGVVQRGKIINLNLRPKVASLMRGETDATSVITNTQKLREFRLKVSDALERFYKREIEKIASQRGHSLVIVTSSAPYSSRKVTSLADYQETRQRVLVRFAMRKLGKRLTVLPNSPHNIGNKVKPFASLEMPVTVFGEFYDACVEAAASSLTEAGFRDVRRVESKSVG